MNRKLRIAAIGLWVIVTPGMLFWLAQSRAAELAKIASAESPTTRDTVQWWDLGGVEPSAVEVVAAGSVSDAGPPDAGSPDAGPVVEAATYTVGQVKRWAYDRSPEARLIEAEVQAVLRGVDPKDPESCCSAILIRDVLSEVALARRSDDATHAAVAYHKLVATIQARGQIEVAIGKQDELIAIADEAQRLELSDRDPLEMRQARLELLDLKSRQRFGELKLRQELSRLTGRDEAEVAMAVMIDPLPVAAPDIIAGQAVSMALERRHDLQAVSILADRLNSCNLNAARLLMGVVSPGAGLSLAAATRGLFSCLKEDHSDDDLRDRRRQAKQMVKSLEEVIRNETLQAVLDVRAAEARLKLVEQRIAVAGQQLNWTEGKLRIDESPVGSDLVMQLKIAQLHGQRVDLLQVMSLAMDDLDHARSIAPSP